MKRCSIILLGLIVIGSTGCRKKHVEPYGYVWYEIRQDGLYGAEDENGKILLPCIFTARPKLDTCFTYVDKHALKPCKNNFWYWKIEDDEGKVDMTVKTWEEGRNHELRYSVCTNWYDSVELTYYYGAGRKDISEGWKTILFDTDFNIIYEGYLSGNVVCSYNCKSYWFGGDMGELILFTFDELYEDDAYSVFINKDGEAIIPASRKYIQISPQMIDNHCFYIAYMNNGLGAVLDNRGTELFRFQEEKMRCAYEFTSEALKHANNYDANIDSHQWTTFYGKTSSDGYFTYDAQYGFGFVEPWKEYPGEPWDDYDGYERWREHYIEHPDIVWTHIMLPTGSETFDAPPSFNNRIAPKLNLEEIASRKRR